jgi:hypothetical protein
MKMLRKKMVLGINFFVFTRRKRLRCAFVIHFLVENP